MDASKNAVKGGAPKGARRFYEFGGFRLDANKHRLLRNGEIVPLFSKAVETLTVLVQNPGKLLEREALMQAVWPDTTVEDANLTVAISQLRKALNQNSDSGEFIQTIARVGYRFVADVHEVVDEPVSLISEGNRPNARFEIDGSSENGTLVSAGRTGSKQISVEDFEGSRARSSRYSRVAVAGTIVAISIVAVGAFLFFGSRWGPHAPSRAARILTSTQIPEKSVAVLPFENLSDEKQNAYFAAGIQDETISDLARITELKVISRTSANHYKSENGRNSRKIGQQLGVAHLLEGSVQRIGNRLRVHAQLIDTRTDTHVWAQTYDRDVADLFAVQSEIAQAIAEQLRAKISPAVRQAIERAPTADLTAFDLYTRAKNLFLTASTSNTGKEDLLLAADLLSQAVARDPAYLQAYCQLVWVHDLLYLLGHDHTPARLALAEAAVQAALRLGPETGEAHLARAENLYRGYLDYDGALAELDIARQSLPNDSRVFGLRAYIERRQGNYQQALRSFALAMELDPRNVSMLQQIAISYWDLRRYAEGESVCDRALAIEPNDTETKITRARLEFDWKADTRPLHQVIDSIRATNPAALRDIADNWIGCALAERDVAAANDALIAAGQNSPINNEAIHFNRPFAEGIIARILRDDDKARSAFIAARAEQEKTIQAEPNYGPPLCVLGLINAALGRKEEALREGRRATELLPVEKDAINGPLMIEYFAMIAAWVGDKDLACEQLARTSGLPMGVTYGEVKLLPFWDPLHGDPRFEKIVASLAPK
jgi:serine/threonine-protein kinase